MKNIIAILMLALAACGAEPNTGEYLDISVCSEDNALHGTFIDYDGEDFGRLTFEGCRMEYRFGTGCVIYGQYAPENDSAGSMDLQITNYTPSCVGEIPSTSSCTFELSDSDNNLYIDCVELDHDALLRREGF